jgi:hypothetical protein
MKKLRRGKWSDKPRPASFLTVLSGSNSTRDELEIMQCNRVWKLGGTGVYNHIFIKKKRINLKNLYFDEFCILRAAIP